MIKTLINKGAEDVDIVDEDERTPLHLAARDGRLGMVKTLINRGACVNRVDKDERTPLRLVVEDDHTRLIPHLFLKPGV